MHIQTATATMAQYPSLPASPTLTNPDMILPYGEYDDTPSPPPQDPYRPHSPDPATMSFSIGSAHSQLGPVATTTPIIYGNGTMLSDIGEVTEAESTLGRTRKIPGPAERRLLKQRQASPLRSSPTIGYDAVMKRTRTGTHQRKISVESNSTVTSEPQAAEMFKDFDDGISVDDSVFQGDDEESVADSYAEEVIASETRRLSRPDNGSGRQDDDNSSAALSRRAEQILLNAKKRLNNMEGNLSRARSSLFSPPNSAASIHSSSPLSRSTPSPPTANGLRFQSHLGKTPANHRQLTINAGSGSSPGHNRGYSENSIAMEGSPSPTLTRSASAAARYGRSKYSPENGKEDRVGSALGKPSPPLQIKLQPLDEDEPAPEFESRGLEKFKVDTGRISPGMNPHGLTRSTSSMQMRDLQGQMDELKGRLSVLRDRARSDMKRRSLQSLRTPSPFTAAEQWYAGAKGYGEGNLSADAVVPIPPWNQAPIDDRTREADGDPPTPRADTHQYNYASSDMTSIYEDVGDGHSLANGHHPVVVEEREVSEDRERNEHSAEGMQEGEYEEEGYNEDVVEPEEDDYESDASLYHDTSDVPISHEDREDAFDYEHFFLHSAMGTISQQRMNRRGSAGSFSSEDSVETTRGPTTNVDPRSSLGHLRSESNASVSTLASFATATEGLDEDDEDHDNFAVQDVQVSELRAASPPLTAKRSTFGATAKNGISHDHQPTAENIDRPGSAIRVGSRQANGHSRQISNSSLHRQESTGTTRSFPLVNQPKSTEHDSILSDSTTLAEDLRNGDRQEHSPVSMLARDDQILIENVVASVGKCVLGLQDAGASSYEARLWRRRLDAARRILEGEEGAV